MPDRESRNAFFKALEMLRQKRSLTGDRIMELMKQHHYRASPFGIDQYEALASTVGRFDPNADQDATSDAMISEIGRLIYAFDPVKDITEIFEERMWQRT